jgi:hypothetical protein
MEIKINLKVFLQALIKNTSSEEIGSVVEALMESIADQ